jgi:DNA-directed RNA polymerase specialized sigma24 family protein
MEEASASSLPQDTPERLLERYLSGDDDAFGELAGRYEVKLFAFIQRMTGDEHLAEDIFQQVFVKVAKNASSFDGRASF